MRSMNNIRALIVCGALLALAVTGAGVARAVTAPGVTKVSGGAVTGYTVAALNAPWTMNGPGPHTYLSTNVSVPAGQSAILLAHFSAQSECYGGSGWCTLTLLVDGKQMLPAAGSNFAFDSTEGGTRADTQQESHAIERSIKVGSGKHTVSVVMDVTAAPVSFSLFEGTLSVERIKV
jgi:hypothetical protein